MCRNVPVVSAQQSDITGARWVSHFPDISEIIWVAIIPLDAKLLRHLHTSTIFRQLHDCFCLRYFCRHNYRYYIFPIPSWMAIIQTPEAAGAGDWLVALWEPGWSVLAPWLSLLITIIEKCPPQPQSSAATVFMTSPVMNVSPQHPDSERESEAPDLSMTSLILFCQAMAALCGPGDNWSRVVRTRTEWR